MHNVATTIYIGVNPVRSAGPHKILVQECKMKLDSHENSTVKLLALQSILMSCTSIAELTAVHGESLQRSATDDRTEGHTERHTA